MAKPNHKSSRKDQFIAKTLFGLEELLAEELRQLGAQKVLILRRAVSFDGDKELMYRANLHCRTALRILKVVYQFTARNEEELYRGIQDIFWEKHMSLNDTLSVDAVTSSEIFRHSKYAALKTKDAICDQFRRRTGKRPSVETRHPNLKINVHIFEDKVTVSLDSSGSSLHMRNYRQGDHPAPINEVLAAGMIMLTGWDGTTDFIDPMCGSGTLLAEAALITQNIAPGALRRYFGFQGWRSFNKQLWEKIKKEERENRTEPRCKIFGYDKSNLSIRHSKDNLFNREFSFIRIKQARFSELEPPVKSGIMVFNPPYGERLGKEEDIDAFYTMIGDSLKQRFAGYDAWIISSNKEALKQVGLRATNKHQLYNGALDCKFQCFSMYEGSLTPKGEEEEE